MRMLIDEDYQKTVQTIAQKFEKDPNSIELNYSGKIGSMAISKSIHSGK
jgi:hypothetical protein